MFVAPSLSNPILAKCAGVPPSTLLIAATLELVRKLSLLYQNNVLLLGGANANGHYWKQFVAGEFTRRRMLALSATDGHKLWAKMQTTRGGQLPLATEFFAEPWSFDLYTGQQQNAKTSIDWPRSSLESDADWSPLWCLDRLRFRDALVPFRRYRLL